MLLFKYLMVDENLTPPEFNTEDAFTVTFRRPFDFNKWVKRWVENKLLIPHLQHILIPSFRKSYTPSIRRASSSAQYSLCPFRT